MSIIIDEWKTDRLITDINEKLIALGVKKEDLLQHSEINPSISINGNEFHYLEGKKRLDKKALGDVLFGMLIVVELWKKTVK